MKTKKEFSRPVAIVIAISALLLSLTNANAQLTQIENLFGKYTLSVDGCENNNGSGQGGSCPIAINKPAGAYLYKAYLLASQTPIDNGTFSFTTPLRVNTTNSYTGSIGPVLPTFAISGGGYQLRSRYGDVTADLSGMLNGLPTGASTLYLIPDNNQPNNNGDGLEGRALLVIWNDPNGTDKVISIALGSTTSLPPTTFTVNTPPLNIAAVNSTAIAGLGISFSLGLDVQLNNVSVNSTLITTQAGGYDDGTAAENGNLFTIGDDADPLSLTSEKYDIKSALVNASTSYTVTFENVLNHEYDYLSVYYSVVSGAFQSGTITGTLYTDANTNLNFDTGEPGLPANITVDLYRDIDGVPGLNTATDQLVATTVTNASGQYTFPGITVGTNYMIRVNTADPDIPSNLTIETTNPVLNVASTNATTSTVDFGFILPSNCPPSSNISSSATICASQTYQLPWGPIVNTAGIYADTVRNLANTCDSIITSVNLSVFSPSLINTEPHICPGQNYQLPWGTSVNTTGFYADTIRNQASCDSVITTVHLIVDQVSLLNTEAHICPNQTFTLPSGTIVSAEGIYIDTLRSQASCDSIINTIHLLIDHASLLNTEVHICPGQTYQLPSGLIVSIEGIYPDTLRSQASCDSIINTINLVIDHAVSQTTEVQICANQSYQLPSGVIVTAPGVYIDTIRSVASCDSIINSIHLVVNSLSYSTQLDSIYDGQPYILPSGLTVSTAGTYQSILTNSLGCDSIISTTLTLRKTLDECITRTNAITPNGDGINDYWVLYRYRCFKKLAIDIFNRYGSPVFHADDYQNDWNGKYKGKELPDGTYYYIMNVTTYDGKIHVFRDNVTLVR